MEPALRMCVLGPLEARRDGLLLPLGTPRQRQVLAALTLRPGATVSPDVLIDLVWGDGAPAGANNTLQGYVAGLRKVLEPERVARGRAEVLPLGAGGYQLRSSLDVTSFEAGIEVADRAIGTARDDAGVLPAIGVESAAEVVAGLHETLQLWRGSPWVELGDAPAVAAERARLEELHLLGLEHRAALEILLGREARVATDLETLTATYPLRERMWALRMVALARAGRQSDALAAMSAVRRRLADELGIDPGPELTALHVAVLRQDPVLGPQLRRARRAETSGELAIVGRDAELDALMEVAARGDGFAVITGEPGMGKSRLCRELVSRRAEAGDRVLTARCSQDDGAPPLWPWTQILRSIGARLPAPPDEADAGARFRAWDDTIASLFAAARERPTVVVLDDLQWADSSTLRVLALLAGQDRPASLTVVLTWRSHAELPRALEQLAAALARQHTLHLRLEGLDAEATARLVADLTGTPPDVGLTEALQARTGGNPFLVAELARAGAGTTHDLDLAAPEGIRAVLAERLTALSDDTVRSLEVAAVLGAEFNITTLAGVLDESDDTVIDRLESAQAAGLVQEIGIDRFRFAHDLLREQSRAGVTQSRRTRIHASAATTLSARGVPGSEADLARHWLQAGPTHAARAWRAARAASEAARLLHAHDERIQMTRAAIDAIDTDPTALEEDRCDLLLDLAEGLRVGAQWFALRPVVHEALALAERLDDAERAFTAATLPTRGAFWLASPYGQVDDVVVLGLRRILDALPHRDEARRCRVMLSLASEIYYAASVAEREALVDEAVAMARRLGDDRLLLGACLAGSTSIWRSSRTVEQLGLAQEAVALARALNDPSALADALTVQAAATTDLGLGGVLDTIAIARTAAVEQRLLFNQVLLHGAEIAWRAMRGEDAEVARLADDMIRNASQIELAQLRDSLIAVGLMQMLWGGHDEELLTALRADEDEALVPTGSFVAALLCRTGRVDEAAAYVESHDLRIDGDDWLSPAIWSLSAEVALHLGDRALAATLYQRLLPLAGRPAAAGQGIVVGPVDAFLAMAAHAVGELETAHRHADDAERVAQGWTADPVLRWVRAVRARWGV